ncbi:MAG: MmgE/PrpD family protein [Burkholderiaceae bacterium]|nr:MmgE/PrpD family protein [Burkholderiaceae bacterium]MCD8517189.1 MmgE/PrpD family protein [Burkholderiaceae bacterium]MCD8536457.1 MmgE/PrpD family protein [Burkholderiaceae bacterium]MCD8565265.1 MmgE/PrpD family protein [Burkholderiaceae bacterium]
MAAQPESIAVTRHDVSRQIASFAAGFDASSIPREVFERAKHLILDSIGIAFASGGYDFAAKALAGVCALDSGAGKTAVIGHNERLDLRNAILMNGILVHGLDFDDTHAKGVIHATASVLPTVLGVAAAQAKSGKELLTAYVLGIELATRLGAVAKGGFHQLGFHPTGLVGTFGCAMAAAWLMGANTQQCQDALGLSLSTAAGSLEFLEDGAWNKRMHPGWAGAAAVTSATLAMNGYRGTSRPIEGRFGLFNSYLGERWGFDIDLATENLGNAWEVLAVSVKPLPACHFTHAAVDAAIRLHQQGLRKEDIESIHVLVPYEVIKTVCEPLESKRRPANSYEAQFSIPYLVATGLLKGRMTLEELEDQALSDPEVLKLCKITNYAADPDTAFPKYYDGEVIVHLKNGKVLREREAINRGAVDRPLTSDDIKQKFYDNMALRVTPQRAEQVERAVLDLDGSTANELARILGQA